MSDISAGIENILLKLSEESSSVLETMARFDLSKYFNVLSPKSGEQKLEKKKVKIKIENSYK